jgi:hypothetical protein
MPKTQTRTKFNSYLFWWTWKTTCWTRSFSPACTESWLCGKTSTFRATNTKKKKLSRLSTWLTTSKKTRVMSQQSFNTKRYPLSLRVSTGLRATVETRVQCMCWKLGAPMFWIWKTSSRRTSFNRQRSCKSSLETTPSRYLWEMKSKSNITNTKNWTKDTKLWFKIKNLKRKAWTMKILSESNTKL